MAEMTFFESFRFIDTYTQAVLKLQEASHAVQRNGADLKEWEAEGKLLKEKIKKEIDALNNLRMVAVRKGQIEKEAVLERGKQAEDSIEPLLQRASTAKGMLDQVSQELNTARETKAVILKEVEHEAAQILQGARAAAEQIALTIEDKRLKSEERLVEVENRIAQIKSSLSKL